MDSELTPPGFVDPMLRMFVDVMCNSGVQLGMSVIVGGNWISGTLIPPRMYMEELGDEMAARGGPSGKTLRDSFFAEVGRTWFPSESEREAGDLPPSGSERTYHLHLRGARCFVGSHPIPADGFYVRLRLDQVSGWTIGEMGPPGYQPPGPPPPRD